MSEGKSFFQTLPGILTGLAAVIGAVTGLYLALKGGPMQERVPDASPPPVVSNDQVEKTNLPEQIRGVWKNADPDTRGVTKLVILRKDGKTFVHAWGKCHPQDCDWGEARGAVEGDILKVTWRWVGGTRDMSIRLKGKHLKTETINVYDDKRPPRESSESFVRST